MIVAASGFALAQPCEPDVLGLSDAGEVHDAYRPFVAEPGRYQRQLPSVAGGFYSELLCAAVERVVYIRDAGESSGTMGWVRVAGDNDLVHVDGRPNHAHETDLDPEGDERIVANVWANAVDTLVHEAAHSATHLLHTQIVPGDCFAFGALCDEPTDASQWRPEAIALARAASERARLGGGFRAEWERMHEAFVDAGLALPYGGGLDPDVASLAVARAGVMTPYGLTSPSEDLAEMIAKTLVEPSLVRVAGRAPDASPEDAGCRALESADAVQSWNAALIAKLGFLLDVGLIDAAAYERCTAGLTIDTRNQDGFHTFTLDGAFQRSYEGQLDVTMGLQPSSQRIVFVLEANGTASFGEASSPVRLRLVVDVAAGDADIDRVSWPRGLYWLGQGATSFSLSFESEDLAGASFQATAGPLLITRASSERIEGSLVIQAGTRSFMAVPLVEEELRRVTFRVSR